MIEDLSQSERNARHAQIAATQGVKTDRSVRKNVIEDEHSTTATAIVRPVLDSPFLRARDAGDDPTMDQAKIK